MPFCALCKNRRVDSEKDLCSTCSERNTCAPAPLPHVLDRLKGIDELGQNFVPPVLQVLKEPMKIERVGPKSPDQEDEPPVNPASVRF